ncbi:MAG: hypothetical protein P0S94_03450 [Simkaniaceae bacterium]|nr:hypothetical protein [Simkaniaceae bacterium]
MSARISDSTESAAVHLEEYILGIPKQPPRYKVVIGSLASTPGSSLENSVERGSITATPSNTTLLAANDDVFEDGVIVDRVEIIVSKMRDILMNTILPGGTVVSCPRGCSGTFTKEECPIEGGKISHLLCHMISAHGDYGKWSETGLMRSLRV